MSQAFSRGSMNQEVSGQSFCAFSFLQARLYAVIQEVQEIEAAVLPLMLSSAKCDRKSIQRLDAVLQSLVDLQRLSSAAANFPGDLDLFSALDLLELESSKEALLSGNPPASPNCSGVEFFE